MVITYNTNNMMMTLMFMLTVGPLLILSTFNKNLLSCLLALEMMMLTLIIIMIITNSIPHKEMINIMMILVMAGSEASISLSCLVSMLNIYGHDSPQSLSTLSSYYM